MKARERLENFFRMPLASIIDGPHWRDGVSINELGKRAGVTRQAIIHMCKVAGIRVRSVKEATGLTKNKGERHWAWGKTKETHPTFAVHSRRMKRRNPCKDEATMEKLAIIRSKQFKKKPLTQESQFARILRTEQVSFVFQEPIGRYIIDFFIPEKELCIEIDNIRGWSKERYRRTKVRDRYLGRRGFRVVRIDKSLLANRAAVLEILRTNDLI